MTASPSLEEKLDLGRSFDLGAHVFQPDEIKAFASRYDPQPFHLDEEAAKNSLFGRLCASGWHTVGMWMRHNVLSWPATMHPDIEFGPARGIRDLKWLKPAYAGEAVSFTRTTLSCRALPKRPGGWHLVDLRAEALNAAGEPIMTFTAEVMVREKP